MSTTMTNDEPKKLAAKDDLDDVWFEEKPRSSSKIPLRRSSAPPAPIQDPVADRWFK